MTLLVLVRHGQTAWNRQERFRGQADIPLDEAGLAQAERAGRHIAALWQPAAIYASPLSRAHQTAAAIAQHFELHVQPHPGLLDIHYGDWQGLTPTEVAARWLFEFRQWQDAPATMRIPGGESLEVLRERGMEAVRELVARHTGETIILVGHTVINRVLLLSMMGVGLEAFWRLRQDPCAINVIEADAGQFVLCLVNQTLHLRD
ncbi:MAG: Phosphoserine phosphatase 1 [Chloroflexi bacterium ADurb.Bin360]|jgi:probable phosphoglycerate mutase|nr:MAG: Phosphoserine phosphatase 1 [Chloroflexi bacterium ADurb.Bin360]